MLTFEDLDAGVPGQLSSPLDHKHPSGLLSHCLDPKTFHQGPGRRDVPFRCMQTTSNEFYRRRHPKRLAARSFRVYKNPVASYADPAFPPSPCNLPPSLPILVSQNVPLTTSHNSSLELNQTTNIDRSRLPSCRLVKIAGELLLCVSPPISYITRFMTSKVIVRDLSSCRVLLVFADTSTHSMSHVPHFASRISNSHIS